MHIFQVLLTMCACHIGSVLALKTYYPLELNWQMCLIKRNQRLARNSTYSEPEAYEVSHQITYVRWVYIATGKPDLDASPTILHQRLFDQDVLEILKRSYGKSYYINMAGSMHFNVTATGPTDPSKVLMRLKGVYNSNRSNSFTMELYHTGDGTNVYLHLSRYIYCSGSSCGQNGLPQSTWYSHPVILQEIYFNGWTASDTVELIDNYKIYSYVSSCNRVDVNVEAFMTHKNYTSETSSSEQITIPVHYSKSSLNDSSKDSWVTFSSPDIISIDVYLDINTTTSFSVFMVLETNDDCLNYQVMSKFACVEDCSSRECYFQHTEIDDYHGTIRYCRFKCMKATKVYVRRTIRNGKKYLPSATKIIGLTALGI